MCVIFILGYEKETDVDDADNRSDSLLLIVNMHSFMGWHNSIAVFHI